MSDFAQQRRAAFRERNALNKQRARQMENRIAKELNAFRVPFSGAGAVKGDVFGSCDLGQYIIECKMSSAWSKTHECPDITIAFAWLQKLEREIAQMRYRFGALVFHYHSQREDFAMLSHDTYTLLFGPIGDGILTYATPSKTVHMPLKTIQYGVRTYGMCGYHDLTADAHYYVIPFAHLKHRILGGTDV